jgi:plastocyanin
VKRAAVVAAIPALALAAPTGATERAVTMPGTLFEPERVELLVGDTITWTNLDAVRHTVTANNASFDSGDVAPDQSFSLTFAEPGRFAYHCSIHRFMTGEVDVFALALSGPLDPVPVGARFALRGLATPGAHVEVERRGLDGVFSRVGEADAAADGRFRVSVPAVVSADYRAATAALTSALVHVGVSPRVTLRVRRVGRVVRVEGLAVPAQPRMPVALQVYSRERFDWFTARRSRLDPRSRVRFALTPRRKLHLRLVVLRASAGLVRGTSNVVVAAPVRPAPRRAG